MVSAKLEVDLMSLADIGQPTKLALEVHRQLRAQFGCVPLRIPLLELSEAVGIVDVAEFDTDSFEGTLVVHGGRGAIGIRKGMRSGRRNFTLSHELGHFLVPNHRFQSTTFQCAIADLRRERANGGIWERRPALERIEVEANEFAAALLVPLPEFRAERGRLGSTSDLAHIRRLANAFDVSQEMMARLYVENADEQIAVITSRFGKVHRVMPRAGFPFMGLRGGFPVSSESVTASFGPAGATDTISELREIPTHVWLERRGSVSALYEQVFMQEDGWAMTLLVTERDECDEDDDDSD